MSCVLATGQLGRWQPQYCVLVEEGLHVATGQLAHDGVPEVHPGLDVGAGVHGRPRPGDVQVPGG